MSTGGRLQQCVTDSTVKIDNVTALKSMFTAWYKRKFWPLSLFSRPQQVWILFYDLSKSPQPFHRFSQVTGWSDDPNTRYGGNVSINKKRALINFIQIENIFPGKLQMKTIQTNMRNRNRALPPWETLNWTTQGPKEGQDYLYPHGVIREQDTGG